MISSLLIALTLGFITGSGMLIAEWIGVDRGIWWITHAQAHGMAQIFGFTGLFTIGVGFHVVPRFRNGAIRFPLPQRVVLITIVVSVILRFAGQSINRHPTTGVLAVISAVLLLVGAFVFSATIFNTLRSGRTPRGAAERWISMAIFWFAVSAALHLRLTLWLFDHEASIAPYFHNIAVIESGLFGFVFCFIFAVSNRAVIGFLGLKPIHKTAEITSWVLFNAGLAILVVSSVVESRTEFSSSGGLLMAAGIVLFVYAIRVLEPSLTRRPPISPGAYPRFGRFLRSAYVWLIISAVLLGVEAIEEISNTSIFPADSTLPVLHVATVGFATFMVTGMGSRMIPLFEGSILPWHKLMDAAFYLLTISVFSRTFGGFVTGTAGDWLLGISGSTGLIAVICGFLPILWSLRKSSRDKYTELAQELGRIKWAESKAQN